MKIIYEYGKMFIIHSSGHVDTYDKDSVEAQKIHQQNRIIEANKDVKTLDEQLIEMDKTVSGVETEPVKKGTITTFIRRLKDAFR